MKIFRRVAALILLLLILSAIFQFSSQTAGESDDLSLNVSKLIFKIIYGEERPELASAFNRVLRKIAHFAVFFALGFALCFFIGSFNKAPKTRVAAALISGFVFAVIDESHQIFVSGRGPGLSDVCIDFAGIALATAIYSLVSRIFYAHKNKKGS